MGVELEEKMEYNRTVRDVATKISPPWVQYVNAMKAMFGQDPEIRIEFHDETDSKYVKLYVDNQRKADALGKLLPLEMSFGGVDLGIIVVVSNLGTSAAQLYKDAFDGNPVVEDVCTIQDVFTNPLTYVNYKKEVVQYYNDDLSDAHGNRTTLYQELAKELFIMKDGVSFCTNNK